MPGSKKSDEKTVGIGWMDEKRGGKIKGKKVETGQRFIFCSAINRTLLY